MRRLFRSKKKVKFINNKNNERTKASSSYRLIKNYLKDFEALLKINSRTSTVNQIRNLEINYISEYLSVELIKFIMKLGFKKEESYDKLYSDFRIKYEEYMENILKMKSRLPMFINNNKQSNYIIEEYNKQLKIIIKSLDDDIKDFINQLLFKKKTEDIDIDIDNI